MRGRRQVDFELPDANVEPIGVLDQTREIRPIRFQMHITVGGKSGRDHQKRNVRSQNTGHEKIHRGVRYSARADVFHTLIGRLIRDLLVEVVRHDVNRHRPIAWIGCHGVIFPQPHLISVVAQIPAEIIQHRPRFVARGAAQRILARKCWNSRRRRDEDEHDDREHR